MPLRVPQARRRFRNSLDQRLPVPSNHVPSIHKSHSASVASPIILRLISLTWLVPRLIYIPARGFKGHVILTSTAGISRHRRATYGANDRISLLRSSRFPRWRRVD